MGASGFLRTHTTNHLCTIFDAFLSVESSLFPGNPLTDNFCIFVDLIRSFEWFFIAIALVLYRADNLSQLKVLRKNS